MFYLPHPLSPRDEVTILSAFVRKNRLSTDNWKKEIISLIEHSKVKAILSVNSEVLNLYWSIGKDILTKQKELGWGAKVIAQLSKDLSAKFPNDKGYSITNLKYMRGFAANYPDFPYVYIPLNKLRAIPISQATLDQIAVAGGIGQATRDCTIRNRKTI